MLQVTTYRSAYLSNLSNIHAILMAIDPVSTRKQATMVQ